MQIEIDAVDFYFPKSWISGSHLYSVLSIDFLNEGNNVKRKSFELQDKFNDWNNISQLYRLLGKETNPTNSDGEIIIPRDEIDELNQEGLKHFYEVGFAKTKPPWSPIILLAVAGVAQICIGLWMGVKSGGLSLKIARTAIQRWAEFAFISSNAKNAKIY